MEISVGQKLVKEVNRYVSTIIYSRNITTTVKRFNINYEIVRFAPRPVMLGWIGSVLFSLFDWKR